MTSDDQLAALNAELRQALAEMQQVTDELRRESASLLAQVEAERAALRADRLRAGEEYAERARAGEAGRAREELQRRIDREETTWRAVMSGADQHWSAVEVRDEIAGDARAEVDRMELEDPELSESYRQHATLRTGDRIGEWNL